MGELDSFLLFGPSNRVWSSSRALPLEPAAEKLWWLSGRTVRRPNLTSFTSLRCTRAEPKPLPFKYK